MPVAAAEPGTGTDSEPVTDTGTGSVSDSVTAAGTATAAEPVTATAPASHFAADQCIANRNTLHAIADSMAVLLPLRSLLPSPAESLLTGLLCGLCLPGRAIFLPPGVIDVAARLAGVMKMARWGACTIHKAARF